MLMSRRAPKAYAVTVLCVQRLLQRNEVVSSRELAAYAECSASAACRAMARLRELWPELRREDECHLHGWRLPALPKLRAGLGDVWRRRLALSPEVLRAEVRAYRGKRR